MAVKRRGRLHVWAMPAFLLTVALFSLQLISAQHRTEATALGASLTWINRRLTPERPTQRQLTSARSITALEEPHQQQPQSQLQPEQGQQQQHQQQHLGGLQQPEQQQQAKQEQQQPQQPRSERKTDQVPQQLNEPAAAQPVLVGKGLYTSKQCFEAEGGGEPEQRVCVFENLVLYRGKLLYIQQDPSDTVPPIRIAWLRKFEGDDFFHPTVVNQSHLEFNWDTAQVEELPRVGLFHQQHYSNFYHMFSEVAPTIHYLMCKYLGDCSYSRDSKTQLVWIQERRPDIPPYTMLDTVTDTFKCLSPNPVWHKDDAHLQDKVFILRKAVVGVGTHVRAFPEWKGEHVKHYSEPPKDHMVAWRQRMADCFGFGFTQAVAPTDPLRILFINRHYREGRMILNQAELAHKIEQMPEAKAFPSLDIQLRYLNGDDKLLDQAALFWNASLLIWPHGATMALTTFLPRGAQAIEVIPWVDEEKAKQAEWVQAIRDAFSLDIQLHMVQNKDRRRYMFNQDALLEQQPYRDATPEQKVALLERGECPPGVNPFTCPFWWNHWQASVNLDWATLEPAVRAALAQLADLRRAGGSLPASQAAQAQAAAAAVAAALPAAVAAGAAGVESGAGLVPGGGADVAAEAAQPAR